MMTTNLFVIANVKKIANPGSFRILLPFFRTSWGVGVLNSAIYKVFTIRLSLARFWRALGISRGLNPPTPPSIRHCPNGSWSLGSREVLNRASRPCASCFQPPILPQNFSIHHTKRTLAHTLLHDFRLLRRSKCDIRSSGMLRSLDW